jgi:hypothetical protein
LLPSFISNNELGIFFINSATLAGSTFSNHIGLGDFLEKVCFLKGLSHSIQYIDYSQRCPVVTVGSTSKTFILITMAGNAEGRGRIVDAVIEKKYLHWIERHLAVDRKSFLYIDQLNALYGLGTKKIDSLVSKFKKKIVVCESTDGFWPDKATSQLAKQKFTRVLVNNEVTSLDSGSVQFVPQLNQYEFFDIQRGDIISASPHVELSQTSH